MHKIQVLCFDTSKHLNVMLVSPLLNQLFWRYRAIGKPSIIIKPQLFFPFVTQAIHFILDLSLYLSFLQFLMKFYLRLSKICLFIISHACMLCHLSHVQLFAILWTVACQAPLSTEFSRQEYWSGLLCPPSGDLPDLHLLHQQRVLYHECHLRNPYDKPNVIKMSWF